MSENILETIHKRVSVRSYSVKTLDAGTKESLLAYAYANAKGPFGNTARFALVDAGEGGLESLKGLGTYGMIRGATAYLAGAAKKAPGAIEDFGYSMEKTILQATAMGIGTCWLGGTFSRSAFGEKLGATEDEVVPGVTPLGYAMDSRPIKERLIRAFVRASSRKPHRELFFDGDGLKPLDFSALGAYAEVLEAVRIGPSASNKQPWRIVKEAGKNFYHLYIDMDPLYNSVFKEIPIQRLDAGIAMCHFELSARSLGLKGGWNFSAPVLETGKWTYIASWEG